MNILWIPHTPWTGAAVGRDRHLIRHLRTRGHDVATLQWPVRGDGGALDGFLSGLRRTRDVIDDVPAYRVRRLPDVTRPLRTAHMAGATYNQFLFRRDVRWAMHDFRADVLVTAFSSYMTGYPPFDVDIPVLFDYLDLVNWDNHPYRPDVPYVQNADAVLCVSKAIEDRVRAHGGNAHYLPNGADVSRFRAADGSVVRERYGLDDATVVSLIGLNVGSSGLYFIDALLHARESDPSLHGLLVGDSGVVRERVASVDPDGDAFTYVGRVPYDEVASYYAATDIGLYPAVGGTYDDGRSPIKVFEFTACGIPVVAAPIREVRHLSFPNLHLAEANADAFAEGILAVRSHPRAVVSEVERYDWSTLAGRLESIIEQCQVD